MTPIILLALLGIALLVATYRDLQSREIPDTLSLGLITLGLLGNLLLALLANDLFVFLHSLAGFLLCLAIGLLMYYTKQWGGGDAKLLMGIGAILGVSRSDLQLVAFLLLLVLSGAAYGLLATLYLALVKERARFLPAFKIHLRTPRVHRARILLVITGVLLLCAILFLLPQQLWLLAGFLLLALYLLTYSWIFMQVLERTVLLKHYPVAKLTEGDWLVHDVMKGKRLVVKARATGLTKKDIAAIRRARVKEVVVKEGIAFVPAFLIAFLLLLALQHWFGDARLLVLLLP